VDRHGEAACGGLEEPLGDALALVGREQDPLARRPEREEAVEARAGEEVDVRPDRILVDARAALRERRQRGR
jgi:hypothetical protein